MMEHIGYAAMTETPCVFVNVQRGGPSTGLPTLPAQADMMQARWGSHGDYGIIALCPNSPQECFDLTIQAFNLAEEFRVPVMLMMDECVGHMTEKVVIPEADGIAIVPRRFTQKSPDGVPPVRAAGGRRARNGESGRRLSLPRDRPDARRARLSQHDRGDTGPHGAAHAVQVGAAGRAAGLFSKRTGWKTPTWWWFLTGSRRGWRSGPSKWRAQQGVRAGKFRLISAWPFPAAHIAELAARVKAFVVPELNLGQMVHEVERAVAGKAAVIPVTHAGGTVHDPEVILKAIVEAAR